MEWRQLSGRGRIISRVVVHDTPTSSLIPQQPFNVAAIALDEEPEVIMPPGHARLVGTGADRMLARYAHIRVQARRDAIAPLEQGYKDVGGVKAQTNSTDTTTEKRAALN